MAKIAAPRSTVCRIRAPCGAPPAARLPKESAMETPTMKRKKGKIVSV